jgi:hypothetical protein
VPSRSLSSARYSLRRGFGRQLPPTSHELLPFIAGANIWPQTRGRALGWAGPAWALPRRRCTLPARPRQAPESRRAGWAGPAWAPPRRRLAPGWCAGTLRRAIERTVPGRRGPRTSPARPGSETRRALNRVAQTGRVVPLVVSNSIPDGTEAWSPVEVGPATAYGPLQGRFPIRRQRPGRGWWSA